jgi:uncharacterized protein VirK/YbjX
MRYQPALLTGATRCVTIINMSYSKAYKDIQEARATPEYQEYLVALLRYSQETKKWRRLKRLLDPDSDNLMERLQYYDAQRLHSKECSEYQKARNKYEAFRLKHTLKDLTPSHVMKMLGEKVALSLGDMVEEARQASVASTVTDEQFETIKNAALAKTSVSVKDRFISNTDTAKHDPTLEDFEPLPE